MKKLRHIAAVLLAGAVLGTGTAQGASTTNFTDQWFIEIESGWGAAVFQQWDTLFIDLFVYGADGKPTWFVAAAKLQSGSTPGHTVFTGDVYTATGPYYAAPFNSAPVVGRKVGTLTFDATSITTARLTYSVDGSNVVKDVTRQTWTTQDLSGGYYGGQSGAQSACTPADDNGPYDEQDYIDIAHNADNTITVKWIDRQGRILTLTGTYSQAGHMGQVAVTGGSSSGYTTAVTSVTGNLFEIERSVAGITGRGHLVLVAAGGGCTWDGRWGGVRR